MMMNIKEIEKILPHRAPFLQVDRVWELVEDQYILASRSVSNSEDLFRGHFPGNPILPGVIIIEAMAQAAGILAFKSMGSTANENKAYVVAAVDRARFRRPVIPGEQLMLRAEIASRKRTIWKFFAVASVDGEEVGSAYITCAERDL